MQAMAVCRLRIATPPLFADFLQAHRSCKGITKCLATFAYHHTIFTHT